MILISGITCPNQGLLIDITSKHSNLAGSLTGGKEGRYTHTWGAMMGGGGLWGEHDEGIKYGDL